MKQCMNCGKYVDDNVTVCPYCGSQQAPAYNPNPNYGQQYNQNAGYGYNADEWYIRNNCFDSGPEGKARGVAALLAIFLGGLGVQYFYLGKTAGGLITILLTIVTCGLWEILTLIQGILMLCMDNREFERKYVLSKSTLPLF